MSPNLKNLVLRSKNVSRIVKQQTPVWKYSQTLASNISHNLCLIEIPKFSMQIRMALSCPLSNLHKLDNQPTPNSLPAIEISNTYRIPFIQTSNHSPSHLDQLYPGHPRENHLSSHPSSATLNHMQKTRVARTK